MDEFSEILLGVTNASKDVRTASEEQIYSMLSADPAGLCTSLVTCLRQSPVVTVREMAAVLFRRYVFDVMDENFGFWTQVPEETQGQVKQEFLDALVHEEERSVRNKVCDAICLLAKCLSGDIYEATLKFDDNGRARVVRDSELEAGPKGAGHFWPELLYALWQCAQSEHADFRLSALRIFSTMPQLFGDELDRYLEQIKLLLEHSFADDSSDVRVVATKAFAAFMIVLEKPQHPPFFELLPTTLALINDYAEDNPEDACECLTSLTELAEYQPKFFRPNLAVALESMLGLACNTDLNTNVRQTALEVLSTIAEEATHMVKKFDQYKQQCIPTFLNLMAELEEDEEWSKIDKLEDPEETGVAAWAEQALDRLACALGGKAVLPLCFELIPPMLQREEWQYRHAALMALSAIGEGVHKALLLHLTEVVQTILPHLADPHERVRFACCNTVGQMATDFSPKHNNLGGVGFQTLFHAQVVPALLQVTTDAEHPRVQAHAAAALVNFCEHSSKEVLSHHLDDILEHLSGLLESSYIIVQEQAISTLSTVADAAEDLFRSYYSSVMPHLISILAGAKEKEHRMLRGKTMECVSLIGLAVGKEMFLEDAREVMSQFEDAQATSDDPDDPQINYLLTSWARICQILGEDFVPYLKVVLPALLQSLNKEAQVVKLHTEATEADLPDQENWSLADFDDQKLAIKTSALDEKKMACQMLGVYVRVLRGHFAPYLEDTTKIMSNHLTFLGEAEIRMTAANVMPFLVLSAKEAEGMGEEAALHLWQTLGTDLAKVMKTEPQQEVAAFQMCALKDGFDFLGAISVTEELLEVIMDAVVTQMTDFDKRSTKRAEERAQDEDYDPDDDDILLSDEEGVDSIMLRELADLVHMLFHLMRDSFLPYWDILFPFLANMLDPRRLYIDHQWAICMMDDLLEFAPEASVRYSEHFLPMMIECVTSPHSEVRQAAVYGFGIMSIGEVEFYVDVCKQAVPLLMQVINHEDSRGMGNIEPTENAISAFIKIARNPAMQMDANETVAQLLEWLPVTEDQEEGCKHIYPYLLDQLEAQNPTLMEHLGHVVGVLATVVNTQFTKSYKELNLRMLSAVEDIRQSMGDGFQEVWKELTEEQVANLSADPPPVDPQDETETETWRKIKLSGTN
eukprot:m.240431 g.240431  ORF g.240431 m.240431 type:complete len:1144 (+) comp26585_c1_seq13:16-3447(+)